MIFPFACGPHFLILDAMNKEMLIRDACFNQSAGTVVNKNPKRMLSAQTLALMTNNLVNSFGKRDELACKTVTTKELTVHCSVIYQNFEVRFRENDIAGTIPIGSSR